MSRTPTSLESRLMAKVSEGADGCWNFTGRINNMGYGRIWSGPGGTVIFTHRAAFELFRSEIPEGLSLDHLCRNRRCCNPWHLEVVDHRTNMLRGFGVGGINAAKTHCDSGHPFDESNTYVTSNGRRKCRACGHRNSKIYRQQKRASA